MSLGLNPTAPSDPAVEAFWADGECGWRVARHSVRAAHDVEALIYGAAGMILARDPAAAAYERGDDRGFCEAVASAMTGKRQ